MTNHLVIFVALTFGILLGAWMSLRVFPKTHSNVSDGERASSILHLIRRSLVVFLAILGMFFILDKSIGLIEEAPITPFHAAYGAALIVFLRGMFARQSNKAQQRAGTD